LNIAVRQAELEELREEVRQLKELLAPAIWTPREWQLTTSEATLFAHLCSRSIATKESATAAMFGMADYDRDPKSVDVWIHKLRSKLKPFGLDIETVWGRGWELINRLHWRTVLEKEGHMPGTARVAVSFTLDQAIYAGIERRAGTMGKKPADYARQLCEAAYAARVGAEKNMPATDHDLDQAVRAVFCLAGEFSPKAIAKATGLTENLVDDILRGFKAVAGEMRDRPPADKRQAPTEQPTLRRFTADEIDVIRNLWREGKLTSEIAATLDRSTKVIENFASRHRDICPARRVLA